MTSNKKAVAAALIGSLACAMPGVGTAQVPQDRGFYIGGSIGQMDAGDEGCEAGFSCDTKDTAWKIYGGYKFNRHFALEGTYGDWGEISLSTTVLGIPIRATGEIWSVGVAALGMLPLGADRFALFGKLGVLYTEQKFSASAPGVISRSETEDGTELHFGFGVLFNITRNLGVRGEWERLEDSEVDIISIGLQYRF